MKFKWLIALVISCIVVVSTFEAGRSLEDDDFAEFEHFEVDEDSDKPDVFIDTEGHEEVNNKIPQNEDHFESIDIEEDLIVEDDDNEFEHFQDPEEFEGFDEGVPRGSEQPKIIISKAPMTMRARWDAYWIEGLLCCALAVYALGFVVGRTKNTNIALNFLKLHKPLLERNFTLVGESGADVALPGEDRGWRREAEHMYTMWCSGRTCCEGMLLTLKLIKRQDMANVVWGLVRPGPDTLHVRVELAKDDSDPYVLAIAQKKVAVRLAKEMQDISVFCPERRAGENYGLPVTFNVMSESVEAAHGVLSPTLTHLLNKMPDRVQYIHISDKYSGPKQIEETTPTKPPETMKVILVGLTLDEEESGESMRLLLQMTFHLIDKVKHFKLSKEALAKCEKRRVRAAEAWEKSVHLLRQEHAAAKREEKRKLEKEKILAEDDPEKQRRWELKEQKRQMRRKNPKMKQLKVKAL